MYKRAGIVAWSSARIILGRVGMGGVEGGGVRVEERWVEEPGRGFVEEVW